MPKKILLIPLIFSFASLVNAKTCSTIKAYALVCQNPSTFVNLNPLYQSTFYSSGDQSRIVDALHENDCFITPSGLKIKVDNKRDFRLKEYTAKLAHIQIINSQVGYKVDQYSPEGEYLGKKTKYQTQGWAGYYALNCAQQELNTNPKKKNVIIIRKPDNAFENSDDDIP